MSAYAQAFISGLQGAAEDAPDPRYLLAAATAKHAAVCVALGTGEGGRPACVGSRFAPLCSYDLEGFIPRTDVLPRPPTAVCDTPGGCQRWNLDGSPPARDFAQFYIAPFNVAVKNASVEGIMCRWVFGVPPRQQQRLPCHAIHALTQLQRALRQARLRQRRTNHAVPPR